MRRPKRTSTATSPTSSPATTPKATSCRNAATRAAAGPAYLIPYDGEEVKLHWANADQYYVKTTENYASYVFAAGDDGRRVRFEIAGADNEKDNVKEAAGRQRRFLLAGTAPVAVEGDDLIVRFEHRPLTDGEKKRYPGNGNHQQGPDQQGGGGAHPELGRPGPGVAGTAVRVGADRSQRRADGARQAPRALHGEE